MIYWDVLGCKSPPNSRFPLGFTLRKSLVSRKISWSSWMYNPMHPSFQQCTYSSSSSGFTPPSYPSYQKHPEKFVCCYNENRMKMCFTCNGQTPWFGNGPCFCKKFYTRQSQQLAVNIGLNSRKQARCNLLLISTSDQIMLEQRRQD